MSTGLREGSMIQQYYTQLHCSRMKMASSLSPTWENVGSILMTPPWKNTRIFLMKFSNSWEWRSWKLLMPVMSSQTRKCCQDIRPYWALWKLCGVVERAPDPVLVYHPLTWPKSESLTFWALMSAPDKGDCSCDVLPRYSEGNNLEYLQMMVSFLSCQILLLPTPWMDVLFWVSVWNTLLSQGFC